MAITHGKGDGFNVYEIGYKLGLEGGMYSAKVGIELGFDLQEYRRGYIAGCKKRECMKEEAQPELSDLRKRLMELANRDIPCGAKACNVLVVAVRMPEGHIETITNHGFAQIVWKLEYYINSYDDQMRLNHNSAIEIVDFMLV